ncbi:fgf-2 [Cnaphalocrocis medinalis granulovirus]|uniref:Fgf-2 n=1 Tax=Cnaphalocrocis medinalis granulovirus TaxID=1750712 RepID=A0A109WXI8_9BBAC|nr:fgf-2 [Cnaphalocrocis medinalis granulovirus]AMF83848.1 fgf-2 [Cnaphalocrocis medinalis granulovirus]WPN08728.1 fgf-2 [Cnaphalocrocis medinalis granulovirus]
MLHMIRKILLLFFLIIVLTGGTCTTTNVPSWLVQFRDIKNYYDTTHNNSNITMVKKEDEEYPTHLINNKTINTKSPTPPTSTTTPTPLSLAPALFNTVLDYLMSTNKTVGVGYTMGLNDNINFYTDTSTGFVRSMPVAKHVYYFYRDVNNDKYFIRDENCGFLCVNPCGDVFTSLNRYHHYCKFMITNKNSERFGIFTSSNGATITHRLLEFDLFNNILRAKIVRNITDSIIHENKIILKNGPQSTPPTKCEPIHLAEHINLDNTNDKCKLDDTIVNVIKKQTKNNNPNSMGIKKDSLIYYKITIDTKDNNTHTKVFIKNTLEANNVYTLRDIDTCMFLCKSQECGVYYSTENSEECKIKILHNKYKSYFFSTLFVYTNSLYDTKLQLIDKNEDIIKNSQKCKRQNNTNKRSTRLCTRNPTADNKNIGKNLRVNVMLIHIYLLMLCLLYR